MRVSICRVWTVRLNTLSVGRKRLHFYDDRQDKPHMNKREMIDGIASVTGLSKKDSESALNATFQQITGALAKGDEVSILGFGSFKVKERAARTGRNPKNGEPIKIKAAKVPSFKPGSLLKESVNAAKKPAKAKKAAKA
ncbi:MAG: HU family DNA-binding protein [Hahellaceae bacterium]|nr:HU family DNA-binding protein [Hahellaceae bacterium]